ncbi:MAG: hypothetical protein ACJ76Y_29940 [Thermoanaerobaculia bacterium]
MPKQSFAQEVAALEETLAALRSRVDVVPQLALAVGDELAEQIAEMKRLKHQQRTYAMEGMIATEALNAATARGMVHARNIRACAVLLHGPRNARLAQLGIRIRRRPRRGAGSPTEVPADSLGRGAEAPAAARDAAWTAHAGRAGDAEIGAVVQEVGAFVQEIGGEAGRTGGDAAGIGGNVASDWATVPPVGGFPACAGAAVSGGRGNAHGPGGNLQMNRGAAAQAA